MRCGVRAGEDSIGIRLDTDSANGCAVPTPGIRVLNLTALPVGSRHVDSVSGPTYNQGELQLTIKESYNYLIVSYSRLALLGNGGKTSG